MTKSPHRHHRRRKRRSRPREVRNVGPIPTRQPRVLLDQDCAWVAVRTPPHGEARLEQSVRNSAGLVTYRPLMALKCVRRGRLVTITRSAAPGYLFVGASTPDEAFASVWAFRDRAIHDSYERAVLGVYGPIEVVDLQLFSDHLTGFIGCEADPLFLPGQRITVEQGPFAGMPAIVASLIDDANLWANIQFLGRQVPAAIGLSQIRMAA